jgi:spore germination cell wall hydrolase CwlJ-like protein
MDYLLPDQTKGFREQNPLVLLAMCIFGEARSQNAEAKLGVACVARNRMILNRRYMGGNTWSGVLLQPSQFDCFSQKDVNSSKLLNPLKFESKQVWKACFVAAESVYQLCIPDTTRSAIYYFSPPLKSAPRAWGLVEFTVQLDSLRFYRELPASASLYAA